MADQDRVRHSRIDKQLHDVIGHACIVMNFSMRRVAMVAQVGQEYLKSQFSELQCELLPIVVHAEQAMKNENGFPAAYTPVVKLHRFAGPECECYTFAAMPVQVRKGMKEDMPAVHALICELALYEKAPQEVTNTVADMVRDGFEDEPVFRCLVAELDGSIIGMAIYFVKYSTWKGKGIYLDDIVVTEPRRGQGIGRLLFDAVVRDAVDLGANQMHWQVLDWNEPAIRFYRKYNASFDGEWINCKLDGNALQALSGSGITGE